jgi:hypothetical protein
MIPRSDMEIALLEAQLQQTRLDVAELSHRLVSLAADLQKVMEKLNKAEGARIALVAIVSFASAMAGVIGTLAAHIPR